MMINMMITMILDTGPRSCGGDTALHVNAITIMTLLHR